MTRRTQILTALAALALLLTACASTQDEPAGGSADPGTETEAEAEGEGEAAAEGCESVDLADAPAEPVTMRIGHGVAAEEPFWLMAADPELTEHQGTWYEMELAPFRGTEERLQAYQAGELDGAVVSPQAQIRGAATGALDMYAIVTVMREAEPDSFSTSFVALESSGITGPEDLAGKRIAIVDVGSQLDWLARTAVEQGGAAPDDASYVVFPFPAQEEALRAGQIDVAGIPEPFYSQAMTGGGLVHVFDAADLTDFAYDLLTISFKQSFVEENLAAVCAFRDDFAAAMAYYSDNLDEARTLLAGTDFVTLPPEAYLETGDYARPDGGAVDTDGMAQMLDSMIAAGILSEDDRVDVNTLVLPGVSAGQEG